MVLDVVFSHCTGTSRLHFGAVCKMWKQVRDRHAHHEVVTPSDLMPAIRVRLAVHEITLTKVSRNCTCIDRVHRCGCCISCAPKPASPCAALYATKVSAQCNTRPRWCASSHACSHAGCRAVRHRRAAPGSLPAAHPLRVAHEDHVTRPPRKRACSVQQQRLCCQCRGSSSEPAAESRRGEHLARSGLRSFSCSGKSRASTRQRCSVAQCKRAGAATHEPRCHSMAGAATCRARERRCSVSRRRHRARGPR